MFLKNVMTVFPFQINETKQLFNRLSKLKPSMILEKEQADPRDVVHTSAEAKKRRILDQTRTEVLENIRKTL